VDNLESIARSGELRCDSICGQSGCTRVSIAYAGLKGRRSSTHVSVATGGVLSDYVPFYFAPRSPMLYASYCDMVPGYADGQDPIVHLVSCVEALAVEGRFVITDGHAVMPVSSQFDTLAGLDEIDWSIMRAKYWRDTDDDGDRKRRRQAEFLVHGCVPFSAVRQIGAMTQDAADRVAAALRGSPNTPDIVVRRDWYY
jgi:hypothetical protein